MELSQSRVVFDALGSLEKRVLAVQTDMSSQRSKSNLVDTVFQTQLP